MQNREIDSITDDLLPLYKKMAKYDFTKPMRISVLIEKTDNVVIHRQKRKHNSNATNENQLFNVVRNDPTMNNYPGYACTQPQEININENIHYNYLTTPTAGNKNTTLTNNVYMKNQTPHRISEVFENNHHFGANLLVSQLSTDNNQRINPHENNTTAKSLHVLSKYIIELLKVYFHYTKVINSAGTNYRRKKDAKEKIYSASEYYCALSFDIVSHEILPQKHNKKFTNEFLFITTCMANREKLNVTDKAIHNIYDVLIKWAERRIMDNNIRPEENNNMSKLVSNEHTLNAKTCKKIVRKRKPARKCLLQDQQTCIFRFGSPGNEISVNVSTEMLDNIKRQNRQATINNPEVNKANDTIARNKINLNINTIACQAEQNKAAYLHVPIRSTSTDSGYISPDNNEVVSSFFTNV